MARLIGSVVLGYIVMAAVVFAGLSAAYVALGPERAFRPGVYEVSALWALTSIVIGFGAALLGGWASRRVADDVKGPRVLAALVVVLGLALAVATMTGSPEAAGVREEALGALEAMQEARTPVWLLLLNPFIGALGVLVGGGSLGAAGTGSGGGRGAG